jgi:hypothetical protein
MKLKILGGRREADIPLYWLLSQFTKKYIIPLSSGCHLLDRDDDVSAE